MHWYPLPTGGRHICRSPYQRVDNDWSVMCVHFRYNLTAPVNLTLHVRYLFRRSLGPTGRLICLKIVVQIGWLWGDGMTVCAYHCHLQVVTLFAPHFSSQFHGVLKYHGVCLFADRGSCERFVSPVQPVLPDTNEPRGNTMSNAGQ